MNQKIKTSVAIFFLVAFIILLHYIGWLVPVESFFRRLVTPVSQQMYSFSVGEEKLEFASYEDIVSAYTALAKDKEALELRVMKMEYLEQENKELRQQVSFFTTSTYTHVGAEVVGKNIEPLGSTIVINRGSSDGVQKGNPVVVGDGVLIGKILRVDDATAIVRLINDNQSRVAAAILNQAKSIGLIEGGYGISVRMNFIPQNEIVQIGDTIITSGLETGVPRGLIIGSVEAVEKEAYQPFQRAILSPQVSLDKLVLVSVITNISR